jgi:GntR family transcriptional regulator
LTAYTKTDVLIEAIKERIRSGAYRPGDKLPSARELREEFGCSQQVVRTAIDRLRSGRWIVTVPAVGAFVADDPPITS